MYNKTKTNFIQYKFRSFPLVNYLSNTNPACTTMARWIDKSPSPTSLDSYFSNRRFNLIIYVTHCSIQIKASKKQERMEHLPLLPLGPKLAFFLTKQQCTSHNSYKKISNMIN